MSCFVVFESFVKWPSKLPFDPFDVTFEQSFQWKEYHILQILHLKKYEFVDYPENLNIMGKLRAKKIIVNNIPMSSLDLTIHL